MARNKTSKAWMHEHVNDPYVKRAQAEGMRSRAAYKLHQLAERDQLLKPGMVVIDLGAAPGITCSRFGLCAAPTRRLQRGDPLFDHRFRPDRNAHRRTDGGDHGDEK